MEKDLKKRVVIVDDNLDTLRLLGRSFQKEGYSVYVTPYPTEVLNKMDRHVDLVVADYQMPGIDGVTLAETIKDRWGTPVMMITANKDPDLWLEQPICIDEMVFKPFRPKDVVKVAQKLISINSLSSNEGGLLEIF